MSTDAFKILVVVYLITNFLVGYTLREYMINKDYKKAKKKKKLLSIFHFKQTKKYKRNMNFYNNLVWQGWIALLVLLFVYMVDTEKDRNQYKPGK